MPLTSPVPTSSALIELDSIEARLKTICCDLRNLRRDLTATHASKGVLGSRGLTEFVVGLLKSDTKPAWGVSELLVAAEKAGYRPCLRCRPESAPLSGIE